MMDSSLPDSDNPVFDLELQIQQWKHYLTQHSAIVEDDLFELEDHLRGQIDDLKAAKLSEDEAFLVATKRIGNLNAISREYAEVHSGRLWSNLIKPVSSSQPSSRYDFVKVILLAIGAAISVKVPVLFGFGFDEDATAWFFLHNISLFFLPFIGSYFIDKRQLGMGGYKLLLAVIVLCTLIMNLYPFDPQGSTNILAIVHLPLIIWFVVGVLYTGDGWSSDARRMDFVRFSGEYAIYFVLIAFGGGLLTAFTLGMFHFIGFDIEWLVQQWIVPCGAIGATVIVAWLVEAKQAAIENMAPVLTRVFTPLFTVTLVVFLITILVSGNAFDMQRDVLIGLDLMLVLVLGLVLYAVSSRDAMTPVGLFDWLQLLLVGTALLVDLFALQAIAGRIFDMGITPNRVAALGENLLLLVSLCGYAWHYIRFVKRQTGFAALERWQTGYIPCYVVWAAIVVVVFPLIFGFG
ncbi:permease prefix domain 1-containing protein [Neptunicella sp. SCSIO 80796]|uniref:permease prefix domain 1-containing protein n=1 Tax=Neptunicella plasticusilytica TaxID=3117012 RepID=UPI003A4DEE61